MVYAAEQVTIKLQEQVMQEFGVARQDMEQALRCFRSGPHKYPDLKPLALYHRYQRSREVSCSLAVLMWPRQSHMSLRRDIPCIRACRLLRDGTAEHTVWPTFVS